MQTPWMLITGCAMIGWLVPEFIAAIAKVTTPWMMNVMAAVGFALIAGAFA